MNKFWLFIVFSILSFSRLNAEELISDLPDSLIMQRPGFMSSLFNPFLKRIFVVDKSESDSLMDHSYINLDYFKQYEGLKINKIKIKIIKPFSYQDETALSFTHGVEDLANSLHSDTREFVVMNHVLFKEDDYIDPYLFAESERFLRRNNYIFDAGILIDENDNTKEADVYIYIQDVWNIQISAAYDKKFTKGNTQIKDINFMGLGGALTLNLKKDPAYRNDYKPDFEYKYSRLFDKFGVGRFFYYSDKSDISYGFGANQEFVQNWLKILGGINNAWYRTKDDTVLEENLLSSDDLNYSEKDIWAGYNFSLDMNKDSYIKYKNLIIATRIIQRLYSKKPINNEYYQDNSTFLGSACFLSRYFYQDNYIYAFGKIEDIPVGKKLEVTLGKEYGAIKNKLYFSLNSTYAIFSQDFGYFLNNINFGTFLKNGDFNYGRFDIEGNYFTKLYYIKHFKTRHYLSLRYSKSINPYKRDQFLFLNTDHILSGYSNDMFMGDKRLVCNLEHDIFTPYTIAGFSTALVHFLDLALLSEKGENIISNPLKSAIGIGIRMKNEHLVFSTIQLSFAYYPNSSQDEMRSFNFYTERLNYYQFDKMNYKKPSVIGQ